MKKNDDDKKFNNKKESKPVKKVETRTSRIDKLNAMTNHLGFYPSPINLDYGWSFGSLSGICLLIQIVTGVFLAFHYVPYVDQAFASVQHIMRDVPLGWMFRSIHSTGASMFFVAVYLHISRGLFYGSFVYPRDKLWLTGMLIFFLMMASAFMGYVLPWGQMSFWGATVITNLISAIPYVGPFILKWIWGGFAVNQAMLTRFYVLHFITPFIIALVSVLHILILHKTGSSNPMGTDSQDQIPFFPYYVTKDLVAGSVFAFVFIQLVFFYPDLLNHPDNYIEANPSVTPKHIVPEWYFLPFYAILRSVPNKLGGVIAMALAVLIPCFLPYIYEFINKTPDQKLRRVVTGVFNPTMYWAWYFFVGSFFVLGWVGSKVAEEPYITIGRVATVIYFSYFFIPPFLEWLYCKWDVELEEEENKNKVQYLEKEDEDLEKTDIKKNQVLDEFGTTVVFYVCSGFIIANTLWMISFFITQLSLLGLVQLLSTKMMLFSSKAYFLIYFLCLAILSLIVENFSSWSSKYSLFLLSLFISFLVTNIGGLGPFISTLTTHFRFVLSITGPLFNFLNMSGLQLKGWLQLSLFLPGGVPNLIRPLLVGLESFSYIGRLVSITVRLFANMLSGHSLLGILLGFVVVLIIFFLFEIWLLLAPLSLSPLYGLESLVGFLQSAVIVILKSLYFSDAVSLLVH